MVAGSRLRLACGNRVHGSGYSWNRIEKARLAPFVGPDGSSVQLLPCRAESWVALGGPTTLLTLVGGAYASPAAR